MIHEQNDWYIGAIGFVIAVMAILLTFYSFQQMRISDKQVEKFTAEIKKAEKISEDLKTSNEAILKYSLSAMNREHYTVNTDWKQQANLFYESRNMYYKYYSQNKELRQKLIESRGAVVFASRQLFEDLLKSDSRDSYDAYDFKLSKLYVTERSFQGDVSIEVLVDFNYEKMQEIGHGLKNPDIQSKWFNQLDKVNDFWINAKVD